MILLFIAGCSRVPNNASNQTKALYKKLGFNDKDNDGIIEKKSVLNLWIDENYKEKADINGDGKIIEAEAKYYLQNLENAKPKDNN